MNIINALKACNGHREQAAALLNQPGNTVPEDEEIRGEIKMSLPLVQISLNMCTFANK